MLGTTPEALYKKYYS